MILQTKICGLSTPNSIDAAIQHGATHMGLVHYEPSPRHVALNKAAELRQQAGSAIKVVLLLVNASPELTAKAYEIVKPDVIQFHGNEAADWLRIVKQNLKIEIWKALGLRDAATLAYARNFAGIADRLLFDSPAQALPGGTGTKFDWSLLTNHRHEIPWGIAGGLSPDNVTAALQTTNAPLVDVSSGVESAPGIKDVDKIAAFLKAARSA